MNDKFYMVKKDISSKNVYFSLSFKKVSLIWNIFEDRIHETQKTRRD